MKVAVAIISNQLGQVLITQRPQQASHAGLWEFPGGKLEPGETAEAALVREIREEINLNVQHAALLGEVNHVYPKHAVTLFVFHVTEYTGVPMCCEGQMDLRWVFLHEITHYSFPEANQQVLQLFENATYRAKEELV